MKTYEDRVQALEHEGLTRSDAQGVVDAEDRLTVKHTPGEWAEEYCGKDTIKIFKTSDKRRVATVNVKASSVLLDEANAKLIAAAPELLETLQQVNDWKEEMESDEPLDRADLADWFPQFYENIQAAISKATGE